jgi:hypothetical protein
MHVDSHLQRRLLRRPGHRIVGGPGFVFFLTEKRASSEDARPSRGLGRRETSTKPRSYALADDSIPSPGGKPNLPVPVGRGRGRGRRLESRDPLATAKPKSMRRLPARPHPKARARGSGTAINTAPGLIRPAIRSAERLAPPRDGGSSVGQANQVPTGDDGTSRRAPLHRRALALR